MERLAEEDPEVGRTRGRCFRGWWVLTGCVLIRLASAPGHSFGIVAFIDSFIDSLHVSRFDVSFAWLIASCASTVLTPLAGAGLDQFGVRSFCWTIAPLLLLSVYGLSLVANASELALCLSAIRFLGPECLSLASGATYQRWFVRTRGRAAALFGLNGLVLMSLPALFTFLIEGLGWRSAAQTLAFLLTSMLLLGTSMVHDTPQAVGLQADGDSPGSSGPLEAAEEMEEKEMEHLDEKVKEMDETEMEEKEMEHLDEKVMDEDTEVDTSSCHSGSSVSSSFASGGDCSCSARGSNSGTTIVDTVTAMDGESSDGTKREATSSSGGDGGGDKLQGMSSSHAPLAVSTLREAARYPLLWCFCLLDTCFCLFWAGFNLTALDVISSQSVELHAIGTSRVAADVFLPLSICQNASKLLLSLLLIDRLNSRQRALAAAGSALGVSVIAALSLALRTESGVLLWSIGYGASTGAYMAFMEVLHASLFGTEALGRLLGLQRAFATFSTGVGPLLFATSHDRLGGSYDAAIVLTSASLALAALPTLLLSHATLREPAALCSRGSR